jgi:hypothetical protein
MEALLHSVLAHNDPGPHNSLGGLSNEAYRLEQEEKKSDEWLGLAKAIESARLEREEPVAGAVTKYVGQCWTSRRYESISYFALVTGRGLDLHACE